MYADFKIAFYIDFQIVPLVYEYLNSTSKRKKKMFQLPSKKLQLIYKKLSSSNLNFDHLSIILKGTFKVEAPAWKSNKELAVAFTSASYSR